MKCVAVYSGTFDPITNGHEDIIKRASSIFDRVIIAVAESTKKNTWFTIDERFEMALNVSKKYANVETKVMTGLLVDFAKEHKCDVIVRGVRNSKDFEYESEMAGMNKYLDSELDTIFFPASDNVQYVSSSFVRELAKFGGDVSNFVSPFVEKHLHNDGKFYLKW